MFDSKVKLNLYNENFSQVKLNTLIKNKINVLINLTSIIRKWDFVYWPAAINHANISGLIHSIQMCTKFADTLRSNSLTLINQSTCIDWWLQPIQDIPVFGNRKLIVYMKLLILFYSPLKFVFFCRLPWSHYQKLKDNFLKKKNTKCIRISKLEFCSLHPEANPGCKIWSRLKTTLDISL